MSQASVFDPPLRRFFDAPEFWELVYEDVGLCHHNCYQAFTAALEACQQEDPIDDACLIEAADEVVACHDACEPLFGIIVPSN
jgi:hypothetical protein